MSITPKIRRVILRNGSEEEIQQVAISEGMNPLLLDAIKCLEKGIPLLAKVLRNFG